MNTKIKVGDKVTGKYWTGERIRYRKVYGKDNDGWILLRKNKGGWDLKGERKRYIKVYNLNPKYRYYWYHPTIIENLIVER